MLATPHASVPFHFYLRKLLHFDFPRDLIVLFLVTPISVLLIIEAIKDDDIQVINRFFSLHSKIKSKYFFLVVHYKHFLHTKNV